MQSVATILRSRTCWWESFLVCKRVLKREFTTFNFSSNDEKCLFSDDLQVAFESSARTIVRAKWGREQEKNVKNPLADARIKVQSAVWVTIERWKRSEGAHISFVSPSHAHCTSKTSYECRFCYWTEYGSLCCAQTKRIQWENVNISIGLQSRCDQVVCFAIYYTDVQRCTADHRNLSIFLLSLDIFRGRSNALEYETSFLQSNCSKSTGKMPGNVGEFWLFRGQKDMQFCLFWGQDRCNYAYFMTRKRRCSFFIKTDRLPNWK